MAQQTLDKWVKKLPQQNTDRVEKQQTIHNNSNSKWNPNNIRVISGGQIGADIGGLSAAKSLGLHTGGYAPVNFSTMKGPMLSLSKEYGLKAIVKTKGMKGVGHIKRDKLNVDMCDVLIAFIYDIPKTGRGTLMTVNYARTRQPKCTNPILFTVHIVRSTP